MRIQRNLNNNYRKSKDEVARKLREVLWSERIRYRKNNYDILGNPSIAVTKYKIAIFCDSSFYRELIHTTPKIALNDNQRMKNEKQSKEYEREVTDYLEKLGWTVLHFSDIDINQRLNYCVETIKEAIRKSSEG